MIKELYDDRKAIIEWLQKQPGAYNRWLASLYKQEITALMNWQDPMQMFRSQGRLEILVRLMGLQDELKKEPNDGAVGQKGRIGS
jgi:hypothetical protein